MDKQVTRYRNQIKKLYDQLKQPNISTSCYVQLLIQLEKASYQYIAALANDETIDYLQFFDLVDVLNDNIACLKEKIRR